MKTLSIRRWMLLSLIAIPVVIVLAFDLSSWLGGGAPWFSQGESAQQSRALDQAATQITAGSGKWSDPVWQRATDQQLETLNVGAEVLNPQGASVYRGGPVPNQAGWSGGGWQGWHNSGPTREIMLMDGGRSLGTLNLYSPSPGGFPAAPLAALLGLLATLVVVGWLMGRYVVRPLEATSRAAHQIATGELDFELPESRVKEVAEVRAAFQAMGEGLRQSIGRQAELEEERRFFIGAIAHDLRTPLFTLRGYLAGLEQGLATSPEKAARYVAVCRQKADQLERLVADLFAYAKADYLEQTLRHERFDLSALLERMVAGLQPRARAREVEIRLEVPPGACIVEGDEHLLERALENLLDNALRHTPAGGEIVVSRSVDPSRISFNVADTGPGIPAKDLPHLFDPLFRGDEARSPETGGAGLGLTIARRILRAHGGDLTAANRPGGGAIFTGWLAGSPLTVETREPAATAGERG